MKRRAARRIAARLEWHGEDLRLTRAAGTGTHFVLVHRATGAERILTCEPAGKRAAATVPVRGRQRLTAGMWDVFAVTDTERRVRVPAPEARLADRFFRAGRKRIRVRAHTTQHGNLSIRITEWSNAEAPTAARGSRAATFAGRAARRFLRSTREQPSTVPSGAPVTFLVMNAFAMGGTVRAVFNTAGQLATHRPVRIVSVFKHTDSPFFPVPAGVQLEWLAEVPTVPAGSWLRRRACAVLSRRPSVLVPIDDAAYKSSTLWTDLLLLKFLRSLPAGVLVTTRPSYNIVAAQFAPSRVVLIGQEHLPTDAHTPALIKTIAREYPRLDALTTVTAREREQYARRMPGRPAVVHIPNSLPPQRELGDVPRERLIVAAGRFHPYKGFDLLIEAFALMATARPDWRLEIYGNGGLRDTLESAVRAHDLSDRVAILPGTSELDLVLRRASMFVLSSRFEAFGMVLIEAMAAGTPVVSFDCPSGPREIITPDVDGVLVPAEDIAALAQAMLAVTGDGALRDRLGAAARESSRRFSADSVAANWNQLLDSLTAH